ncbi:MAG: hypothetical protein QOH78_1576 [Verrucomicrobiota bacterium]
MFALFDELQMLRVILIFVLHPFRLKVEIQGDLITLIDHRAMASRHFAGVEAHHAWNGRKVFFGVRDDFVRCVRLGGIGPKDDDMRKHLVIYEGFPRVAQSVNLRRRGQARVKVVGEYRVRRMAENLQEFRSCRSYRIKKSELSCPGP